VLQIALFVLLSIGLVIQYEVIFPLESYLLPASAASILYIPHGIKTIIVVLSGYRALLPIFTAHLLAYVIWEVPTPSIALDALVSTLVMFVPLVIWNFNRLAPLLKPLPIADDSKVVLFRVVLAVAFVSSLFNALLHTLLFKDEPIELLSFRFMLGDLLGTLLVLALLMLAKRPIIKLLNRRLS